MVYKSNVLVVANRTALSIGLEAALRACPARLSTMGRGLDEDLAYFVAGAAAGRHAGRLLREGAAALPSFWLSHA